MKRYTARIGGMLLAGGMILSNTAPFLANSYDAQSSYAELSSGTCVLFPGDSISQLDLPIYLNGDYDTPVEPGENASWTNVQQSGMTNQAYEVSLYMNPETGEAAGYDIEAAGYILTVVDGTSRYMDDELQSASDNHCKAQDTSGESTVRQDRAYYSAGDKVVLEALPSEDGVRVFNSFTVDSANVTVTQDEATGQSYIIMPDQEVKISVQYADPAPQTDAPQEPEANVEAAPENTPEANMEAVPEGTPEAAPEAAPENTPEANVEAVPEETPEAAPEAAPENTPEANVEAVPEGTPEAVPEENPEVPAESQQENVIQIDAAPENSIFDNIDDQALEVSGVDDYSDAEPEAVPETTSAQPEDALKAAPAAPEPVLYAVNITNGTAVGNPEGTDGKFAKDAVITVTAADPAEGQQFKGWVVDSGNVTLGDAQSAVTTFTMPEAEVTLHAEYEDIPQPEPVLYAVNITNGTAVGNPEGTDGKFAKDAVITVTAADPAEGQQFKGWVVDSGNVTLGDAQSAVTTFTMPEAEVTLHAEYEDIPQPEPVLYAVNITNGTAVGNPEGTDGKFAKDAVITVTAADPAEGQQFKGWVVDSGNVTLGDAQSAVTTFTMPEAEVTLHAEYEDIPQPETPAPAPKPVFHTVVVKKGSGDGDYAEKDKVDISAKEPKAGWRFLKWEVVSGNVILDDAYSEDTSFTMPSTDVTVQATFEKIRFILTVNNGKGDGEYTMGADATIEADMPAVNKVFDKWTIESGNPTIKGADRFYASLTMPSSDVTVKAVYKDGPDPAYNAISNITGGAEYLKGSTITFVAVGNGMDNTNPNPGDYRFRPTGYQIGNVTGSWSDSSYTTSMAINAVGDYTLTVTYTKEVYNGSAWVSDGTTDTKSVSFHVVNALSVKTGDNTPIALAAAAAGAALLIIVVLVVLRIRRRK